jgi:hypothetical protein
MVVKFMQGIISTEINLGEDFKKGVNFSASLFIFLIFQFGSRSFRKQ